MSRPVPLDLARHADLIDGAREFLRVWARPDGTVACFVNPVPVGPDPAAFGLAMADCVRHAAAAYARAVNVPEAEALARIGEGLDAGRGARTDAPAPPPPVKRGGVIIEFVPKQDPA